MPKKAIWKRKKKSKKKEVKTQESNETSRQWQQETQEPIEKARVTMERGLHTQLDPAFPEGVPTSSLTLPRELGWGSNPLADPTPGPGWGHPGRRRGQKFFFFFCFFLEKSEKQTKKKQKTSKKNAKKKEKKRFGRTPPSRRGGPLKFPATFTTFPDGAAKSAKFPPNLAKVHVPRRLVTIRGILFHLQAPKVGWHSQRKRLQMSFCCFFSTLFFFGFFIAFLLLFRLPFFAFLFAFFSFLLFFCFFF